MGAMLNCANPVMAENRVKNNSMSGFLINGFYSFITESQDDGSGD
jgi:hypothetical protein